MDRTQAAEIQKHVLDAAAALDRAGAIIFTLDNEDRAKFSGPLGEVASTLHFELLMAVYAQHPDLQLPMFEEPAIDTIIHWEDVVLPKSVSEADLDRIIFSELNLQWRKTAMIVGTALTECQQLALPISAEMIGARIQALADANRLEGKGNLRSWRHSEVRLKRRGGA